MNRVRNNHYQWGLVMVLICVLPIPAEAHSIGRRIGDFYWGFLHPMTTLESVFPIIALGLLAGQQGAARARGMLGGFCGGLVAGVCIGFVAPAEDFVTWVNLSSFVLLGLMLSVARLWSAAWLVPMAVCFGIFQGWGHVGEMTGETGKALFVSGLLFGGYLSVAILAAVAVELVGRGGWRAVSIRVVGSWIAAIGLMVIALR